MLKPRWKKVLGDLWQNRGRSLTVIVAIVIGLAGAGAVLDAWALLRRITRDEYRATNPPAAIIHVDSVTAELMSAVRSVPTVRAAEARRMLAATLEVRGTRLNALLATSESLGAQTIGVRVKDDGEWPPGDNAFTVEKSSVAFADIHTGDSITLRIGDAVSAPLPVSGIARDAGVAPGWMEHIVYGFVTPVTLATMGVSSKLTEIAILVRDENASRAAVRSVASDVRSAIESAGVTVRLIEVPEPGRHIHAAQMDSFLMIMGAFGLLALAMSALLVINLVTAMLAGQTLEIGVMKAIGARPAQISAMYLGMAFTLGIVACFIAIPLGAAGGLAYAKFAADMLNFSVSGQSIPRWAFVVQFGIGSLLPVIASCIPVIGGARISTAEALRDAGIVGGATPAWLERIRGPRRPFLLSLRNAFRRRQRMALTLLTLSFGGATFLGALDLRSSIRQSVSELYDNVFRFDMTIGLDGAPASDTVTAVASRVTGVASAESWSAVRAATAEGERLLNTFALVALPANSKLVAFGVRQGRLLRADDTNAIVVSRRLHEDDPSLEVGHEVQLVINGVRAPWNVVGIVDAGADESAYTTATALARVLGRATATSVVIRSANRSIAAQAELISRVKVAMGVAGIPVAAGLLMQSSRAVLEDHLLLVAMFLIVMAQLTVVVGGLGLGSSMSLAVLERTREIGVMRAIGATPATILTLVQTEGLVIALASWLFAIPLSLPMSVLLGRAFGRMMFPVPTTLVPGGWALVIWLGVVIIVSLFACAWPSWRATRMSTAAALTYQ